MKIKPSEKGLDGGDWILITAIVSWFHKVPVWWWVMIVFFGVCEWIAWAIWYHDQQPTTREG